MTEYYRGPYNKILTGGPVWAGHYCSVSVYEAADAAQNLQPRGWRVRPVVWADDEREFIEAGYVRVGSVQVHSGDPIRGLYAYPYEINERR